jgi:hypothetical protein
MPVEAERVSEVNSARDRCSRELAAEKGCVLLREIRPFIWQVVGGEDGGHWTNWNTCTTVDTLDGIDVQHFFAFEVRFIFFGMNAIHRTGVNARAVFGSNAGFGDYVSHLKFKLYCTLSTRRSGVTNCVH